MYPHIIYYPLARILHLFGLSSSLFDWLINMLLPAKTAEAHPTSPSFDFDFDFDFDLLDWLAEASASIIQSSTNASSKIQPTSASSITSRPRSTNPPTHTQSPPSLSTHDSRSTQSPVPAHNPPLVNVTNHHNGTNTYSNTTAPAHPQISHHMSTGEAIYESGAFIPIILVGVRFLFVGLPCLGFAICNCCDNCKKRYQRQRGSNSPRQANGSKHEPLRSRPTSARTQTRVTTTTTTTSTTVVTRSDNHRVHDEAPPRYTPLALNLPLRGVLDHDDRFGAPPPSYHQRILDQLHDGPTVEMEGPLAPRLGSEIVQDPSPTSQPYWNPWDGNADGRIRGVI
ncbi:hypothetical protein B0J14DRAFT_258201 [Halenospora varia]|nr:hypothetical protein B0J14DRAFT_258201 [Halenospora varia]